MPRIVIKNPAGQPHTSEETPSQARERQEIEASIAGLRQLRTMRQRISAAQDLTQEQLDRLRQHDPAFTEAIITGLNKRPYRIMKAGTLLYRMTKGDMSGRQIDYKRLGRAAFNNFPEWECPVPEQYTEQMSEAIWDLADVLEETEQKRNDRKAEITGVINAICCVHDLLSIFKEAEVTPPKIYTRIHRRLEKRRAYLDPDYDKRAHR